MKQDFYNIKYMLSLNENDYKNIFINLKPNDAKSLYRKLANFWHPDKIQEKESSNIFIQIKLAYDKYLSFYSNIPKTNILSFSDDESNKSYEVIYIKKNSFELGNIYIGKTYLLYEITAEFIDLYENYLKIYNDLKFKDDNMKKEMSKYILPIKILTSNKDLNYLLLNKSQNDIILSDIISYYKKSNDIINVKHIAWIISSMLNNACFMQYNNLSYCGFSPENYLINPYLHTGSINFFFYSNSIGSKIKFLPGNSLEIINNSIIKNKKSDLSIDLDMIKSSAMNMLGAKNSASLYKIKDLPKDLINWLNSPSKKDAFEEYSNWQKDVLIKSFGAKKFEIMNLNFSQVYM